MHILITGVNGQLGSALKEHFREHEISGIDLPEVDITQGDDFLSLMRNTQPDLVVHCAAYTDVDGSARNPALAHRVNGLGTQNVALACQKFDVPLLHISTNEIFDGRARDGYAEWASPSPVNPYGESKAAAEFYVRSLLRRYYIVRTAWLYAPNGRNFIHSILELGRRGAAIRVVADEVGNPTYVRDLARGLGRLIESEQYGVYHLVNEGACSRYTFAAEVLRLSGMTGISLQPILARDYTRASSPPPFAALQNNAAAALGIRLPPWREALANYFEEYGLLDPTPAAVAT